MQDNLYVEDETGMWCLIDDPEVWQADLNYRIINWHGIVGGDMHLTSKKAI